MNYSVFKLQNQAGRPAIFWEKETIPKKDRKFGYKANTQRFPIRRYTDDRHHVDTDLVSLTPDEPPPPAKPAKNFIKRNREKMAAKKTEPPSTVTLTQEQLNAILKSVGKVAGGSENAVKITVDKHNDTKEIVVESPRRHDRDDEDYDDNDYDDRRERRRKKKPDRKQEDQGDSIYSLLDNKSKPKASSDNESLGSDASLELRRVTKQYKRRKDRKSRRKEEEDADEDRYVREKNRRNKNIDLDDDDNSREKRIRRNRSNNLQEEIDRELNELRKWNKSKYKDNDEESDYEKENRRRRARSKRHESDDEDLDRGYDRRDRDRKNERTKKDDSRERQVKKTRNKSEERDLELHNTSVNKEEDELIPSPRDKIGLPIDLSWRHMTKAERRRLEAARQRLLDEEERKEGDRIKHLNTQYDPDESFKKAPQRHQPTRSDPPATRQTRTDRGRETQITNYTDGNRQGRRSRSPSDQRTPERSPELPSYTTPDVSPKAPAGIPRRHMTLAEKKRQEWERDRVESVQVQRTGNYDPWGKPGAGAPLRTRSGHIVADYKGRQDQMHSGTIPEEEPAAEKSRQAEQDTRLSERRPLRGRSPPPAPPQHSQGKDTGVPVTMRSSFILGQAAPDYDRLTSAKERERKQWLADLEKQIEEKRQLGTKHTEVREEQTWADKLGHSHRPAPFPEQPREIVDKLNTSIDHGMESNRVHSAPEGQDQGSYIRGQNAPIDSVTMKELEDKRKRYLEHQEAVKAQVEEKERQKRLEKERKMKEDMEEERKLNQERELLQKQFDMEQQKIKQKEQQRQAQVNQLKAAMDEAQAQALQEKYQRKMQHLEAGGHDTTKLREHLEALDVHLARPWELTSRIEQLNTRRERDIQHARHLHEMQYWGIAEEDEQNESQIKDDAKITPREDGVVVVEPSHIPGLDLSTARTQLPLQMPTTRRDQPQGQPQGHYSQAQSYGHYSQAQAQGNEPYTENRVLTPSRFRHPSKPWSEPGSPLREFGTQTGNLNASASDLDGDDLSELLNPRLPRGNSEVNIEYKYERGKRVRVISAPKEALEKRSRKPKQPHPPPSNRESSRSPHEHHHEVKDMIDKEENRRKKRLELQRRKGPVKPGSRPMWGYKNADNRKPKKQSERDPFYEQKKRESDVRRLKREQQLLAMVEANKPVIPDYYVPPPKSSRSRSRDHSPFSDVEMASPREVRANRRSKSHSPNRQVLHGKNEHFDSHRYPHEGQSGDRGRQRSQSPPRHREESHSPEREMVNQHHRSRNVSPPVPALRHRNDVNQNQNDNERGRKGGKYGDVDTNDAPVPNGDFVPFTRTIDVLDPTKAEEPLPLSRETTRVANARRAYYEGLHPEKFGYRQYNIQDKHRLLPSNDENGKNPLINPSLVLDHPTNRQDQILMQLSTLKQSLIQRQRELETFSPTDLVRMDTDIKV